MLAKAILTITGEKRDKLLAHVRELLKQVETGSWDLAYADTVVGKLSSVAQVVVGGRSALSPFYQARVITAAVWPNPMGKTPTGAKVASKERGGRVSKGLAQQCLEGLKFWERSLSETDTPHIPLFIHQDGSLVIWGADVFPRQYPFRVPVPAEGQHVTSFVSDAASVGHASYEGVPWKAPGQASIRLGLWTPEQSTWSSNVRECLTVLKAAYAMTRKEQKQFVVFISDNQCAVSMATKLYSKAPAIRAIADEMREVLAKQNAVSAGYHLPGVLNVFTDRPSRAGEALYEQATVAQWHSD